jgi:amidase
VATSALVGVFPTRGLVSIAGIAPLDWMLDNTGPIARNVTDAAIALGVMAGKEAGDPPLDRAPADADKMPYIDYLKPGALKGKRIGVPAFILKGTGTPFHGTPANVPEWAAEKRAADEVLPLDPRTRAAFLKNLDELRAAGATIVMDDTVLPDAFARIASRIATYPYVREGMEHFLKDYGPAQYHSIAAYQQATGQPILPNPIGEGESNSHIGGVTIAQREIETDPQAEANYFGPRRRALTMYLETMERLHLDAYVYPPIQMPPPDDTMPQNGRLSGGPHSDTGWTNMLGVPAVVVSGGFYGGGLPVGLEFSGRPWKDGDLLGLAYGFEQATHHRHPPVLVEQGLLANTP